VDSLECFVLYTLGCRHHGKHHNLGYGCKIGSNAHRASLRQSAGRHMQFGDCAVATHQGPVSDHRTNVANPNVEPVYFWGLLSLSRWSQTVGKIVSRLLPRFVQKIFHDFLMFISK